MPLQITVPSKTFLMGEYLALLGGPALLLNSAPRFSMDVNERLAGQKAAALNIAKNSPAAKFIKNNGNIFSNYILEFHDPYRQLGGFGASSAQFCMAYILKNYLLNIPVDINELLAEYKTFSWNGIGFPSSGADIISQIYGNLTHFDKSRNLVKRLVWPFANLSYCLIHTNNKLPTHAHIAALSEINTNGLEEIINQGLISLEKHDSENFCAAINAYGNKLDENGLTSLITVNLLTMIKKHPAVKAAKGCGALGADVICVLLEKKLESEFLMWAKSNKLYVIASDNKVSEGVMIKKISSEAEQEQVILVDDNDRQIGIEEKLVAHKRALLHRAFSVFIFRRHRGRAEVLLQQRGKHKYHCNGLWTNTCCSHPKPGQDILVGAQQRLKEEMGINVLLYEIGSFRYKAALDNGLTEHEIDHVFVGEYNNKIVPNPSEVEDYRWVPIRELKKDISTHPEKYTPWLNQALELIIEVKVLEEYFRYKHI